MKSRIMFCALIMSATNSGQANFQPMDRLAVYHRPENIRLAAALAKCGINSYVKPIVKPIIILRRPKVTNNLNFQNGSMNSIYDRVEKEAVRVGISPIVMMAIMCHETGNFTSRLWRRAYNPGGIKWRRGYDRSGIYSSFSSPEEGIRAEANVLLHTRYDRARQTKDVYRQVEAIGDAGYAAHLGSWPVCVRDHIARLTGNKIVCGTHHRRRRRYLAD